MRIHRVYCDLSLNPGMEVRLTGARAHYLGRVLWVNPGQTVVLFNGDGSDYVAEVGDVRKQELTLAVNSRLPAARESALEITVAQAVSRGERMDQTLQKCTELGAAAFQPLFSERVEVRLRGDKLEKRLAHWRNVVVSACEQSGRAAVPEVRRPLALSEWALTPADGVRVVLAPGAPGRLASLEPKESLQLAIGPEGGFSDEEMATLESAGIAPVSLGPRTLRTETAAPAAVAVLQSHHGDF